MRKCIDIYNIKSVRVGCRFIPSHGVKWFHLQFPLIHCRKFSFRQSFEKQFLMKKTRILFIETNQHSQLSSVLPVFFNRMGSFKEVREDILTPFYRHGIYTDEVPFRIK